jgi:DNA repair protein RecO (recombination protein O)
LQRLAHSSDHAATLRCFEKHLLQELGYALMLEQDAESGLQIDPLLSYRYVIERGAVRDTDDQQSGLPVSGKTLLDMSADDYRDAQSARQGKQLMRMLLNHHLGGKLLHTRELIKDLTKL